MRLFSLLALLALPAVEIAVFILVGQRIGVAATLGLVALSVAAGVLLLRWQGTTVLSRMRAELAAGRLPGRALVDGAMIAVAGALLIVPGFVTDAAGLLLFLPPVRAALALLLLSRLSLRAMPAGGGPRRPAVELSPEEWRREGEGGGA